MAANPTLARIPALRILAPLASGIAIHRLCGIDCTAVPLAIIILSAIVYLLLSRLSRTPAGRLRWRPYFLAPLALCALSLGWLAAILHYPAQLTDQQRGGRVLTGRVTKLKFTDFSMQMSVQVLDKELPPCRVLLSTRGCDYTMREGDIISWQAQLGEVGHMGNPGEMDYAKHLIDNDGIRYQQHLPVGQIIRTGHSPTLMTRLAVLRHSIQRQIYASRLRPGTQHFVVALLLGDSGMIDKATRQEFAAAGIAHVLALSGMHVGVITLMIWWLLFPLDYLGMKKLRLVITLAAMSLFALFTGFSPSVVRATVMTGFVFAPLFFHRRSASLNALAMAALMILVLEPSAIFQVGFQLSFITVGCLLLLARVPDSLRSKHRAVNLLTSTAIASLVAMLATMALSAHYFHTVSFLSVASNLMVLPVMPAFMALGALFLLVTAAGMQWPLLDWALDGIYNYTSWTAAAITRLPLSHASGVYVSTFGVVAYFVVMALIVLWLRRREHRYLIAAGAGIAVMLAHSLWLDAHTTRQGAIIFNSFSSTPILYYHDGKGYVWVPDEEETDSAAFARYYAGFLARHSIDQLHFVTSGDTLQLEGAMFMPPYAYLMGHRVMAVGSGKWKRMFHESKLALDDIIVTKRYHGTAARLHELFQFTRLIVSGAMQNSSIVNECDTLGIPCHALSSLGAAAVAP